MTIRGALAVLRAGKWLVVDAVLLGFVVALLVQGSLPPSYTVTTVYAVTAPAGAAERVGAYADLLGGDQVAADASALLGGAPPASDIRSSVDAAAGDDDTVVLRVVRDTPDDAALVGSAVGTAFMRGVERAETTDRPVNRPYATVQQLGPPSDPVSTSSPGPWVVLPLGLLAGLLVGLAGALIRSRRQGVVRGPEMLARRIGAPVLAALVHERRAPRRPAPLAGATPAADDRPPRGRGRAASDLAAALRVALAADRTLLFAGPGRNQKTSTVVVDVAVALAVAGERVLLVDADLRSGALATRLQLDTEPGLRELLLGEAAADAVVRRSETAGIDVVPAGAYVDRPATVLGSGEAADALVALGGGYDRVVVDTANQAGAATAVHVARRADGTVLVVRRGTRIEDVDLTVSALRLAGATVLGAVLTHASGAPWSPRRWPPETPGAPTTPDPVATPDPPEPVEVPGPPQQVELPPTEQAAPADTPTADTPTAEEDPPAPTPGPERAPRPPRKRRRATRPTMSPPAEDAGPLRTSER